MSTFVLLQPRPPEVAIEIDATYVGAARLPARGGPVIGPMVESLPAGAVVPSLAALNIVDLPAVSRLLAQALTRLGGRATRAALVIPDTAAKVSLIRFDTVPANAADLTELVRWQVRKSAPFPLDQAVVSFTPGVRPPEGGQEFIVSVARRDIIEQYEQLCAMAGVHAGLIDIATTSVINAVLTGATFAGGVPAAGRPGAMSASAWGDWLLVHVTATYTTLVVLRGTDVIFFRHREKDDGGTLADVVHQTAMYYEDRLKGEGFKRVLLAGGAVQAVDAVRRSLEQRLDVRMEAVSQPELAPLLGILTRERQAA